MRVEGAWLDSGRRDKLKILGCTATWQTGLMLQMSSLLFALAMVSLPAQGAAPQRMFVSGHSLIDQPVPDYLSRIASSRVKGSPFCASRFVSAGRISG